MAYHEEPTPYDVTQYGMFYRTNYFSDLTFLACSVIAKKHERMHICQSFENRQFVENFKVLVDKTKTEDESQLLQFFNADVQTNYLELDKTGQLNDMVKTKNQILFLPKTAAVAQP